MLFSVFSASQGWFLKSARRVRGYLKWFLIARVHGSAYDGHRLSGAKSGAACGAAGQILNFADTIPLKASGVKRAKVDFDGELARGLAAYDDTLGKWWFARASDASHARAYDNVAEFIRASLTRPPRLIVDYACGAGNLLFRLGDIFPRSRLVGLDGSAYLLDLARRRFGRRGRGLQKTATLIETPLPALDFPGIKADLAVFAFPNMVWHQEAQDRSHIDPEELAMARILAQEQDPEVGDSDENLDAIYAFLLLGRLVSRNLRRLLARGGLCVRVEYGSARRDELSQNELMRISYEEGSLDMRVDGKLPRQWFRALASSYFRSGVIEDVHQQSGKRGGSAGGYLITVMRAI